MYLKEEEEEEEEEEIVEQDQLSHLSHSPLPHVCGHALLHRAVDDERVVDVDEEGQLLLPGEPLQVDSLQLHSHPLVGLEDGWVARGGGGGGDPQSRQALW